MNVLLIEDEEAAANRIRKMLLQVDEHLNVVAITDSIEATVTWMAQHPQPDLIISDIHLADGSSFEIFKQTKVASPVIFTTAYDQYAIQAFKLNSIDYLLKPVKLPELVQSLEKFKKQHQANNTPAIDYSKLLEALQPKQETPNFQKRLLIRFGPHLKAIEIDSVAYFYTQEKVTHLCTFENKRLPVDLTLDEVEAILDPAVFFRINRQFIINIAAIDAMYSYSKSRVKIDMKPASDQETIVSAERAAAFKQWLTGK